MYGCLYGSSGAFGFGTNGFFVASVLSLNKKKCWIYYSIILNILEEIIEWKKNSLIIICCFATVYVVPPIASKFLLIEQSAVGAQERCSLMTFTTVVTDMVSLKYINNEMFNLKSE